MFKLVLEKAEEPEIKLPSFIGSWKKQESSRKPSISALFSMSKPLTACAAAAKSLQSCPNLCDPIDGSPPGSFVSMVFSKQKYWSGYPFLSSGDLSNPEIEPSSPSLQADSLPSQPRGKPLLGAYVFMFVISS